MSNQGNGSLTIYVDCVSPYSWFGITNTLNFRPVLNAHGINVDIVPFFLGAARDSAGNPFSPTPAHREAFGAQDLELTAKLLGLKIVRPKDFPVSSLLAIRVLVWIKDHHPSEKLDQAFPAFSAAYWNKGMNISKPGVIAEILGDIFQFEEAATILKGAVSPENKKRVIELTLSVRAFGAPWLVAINRDGQRRDWFGNDRWDQVFDHLRLPFTGLRINAPAGHVPGSKL